MEYSIQLRSVEEILHCDLNQNNNICCMFESIYPMNLAIFSYLCIKTNPFVFVKCAKLNLNK